MAARQKESKNRSLHKAKKDKFNEFYTQKRYIESELKFYKNPAIDPAIFAGKTVYCNCDDPTESEFWKYFVRNFATLGLQRLIATHYERNERNYSYKIEIDSDATGGFDPLSFKPDGIPLGCNGDFRSAACVELLKEADIVVTNPPFSLFREYFAQLMEYRKKFLVIANINIVGYKEVFPHLKNGDVWLGRHCGPMEFLVPDSYSGISYFNKENRRCAKLGNICWLTNLDVPERHEPLNLRGNRYSEGAYPKYDNFDAINVEKVKDIPENYDGVMGVPITYMASHCPEQFEIIGLDRYAAPPESLVDGRLSIKGVTKYIRVLIRKKEN